MTKYQFSSEIGAFVDGVVDSINTSIDKCIEVLDQEGYEVKFAFWSPIEGDKITIWAEVNKKLS